MSAAPCKMKMQGFLSKKLLTILRWQSLFLLNQVEGSSKHRFLRKCTGHTHETGPEDLSVKEKQAREGWWILLGILTLRCPQGVWVENFQSTVGRKRSHRVLTDGGRNHCGWNHHNYSSFFVCTSAWCILVDTVNGLKAREFLPWVLDYFSLLVSSDLNKDKSCSPSSANWAVKLVFTGNTFYCL